MKHFVHLTLIKAQITNMNLHPLLAQHIDRGAYAILMKMVKFDFVLHAVLLVIITVRN